MQLDARLATFFDRAVIVDRIDRKKLRVYNRAGATIRKIARRRFRRRSRPAMPGESPTDRTGKVKKFIFYSLDPIADSLLVGPTPVGRHDTAGALEHGGWFTIRNQRGKYVRAFYHQFPFMAPALEDALPYIGDIWANTTF